MGQTGDTEIIDLSILVTLFCRLRRSIKKTKNPRRNRRATRPPKTAPTIVPVGRRKVDRDGPPIEDAEDDLE